MISRIWHGTAPRANAGDYEQHYRTSVVPDLAALPGFRGAKLLREENGAEVEFTSLVFFEDAADVRGFTGDDPGRAVVTDTARRALTRWDERVSHAVVTVDATPDPRADLIRASYDAFTRRDVERVLAPLHEDVVWANGMTGGHEHGRSAVRNYWNEQFRLIWTTVTPTRIVPLDEDRVAVTVHLVVRPAGEEPTGANVVDERNVRHVFTFDEAGAVTRFDIEELAAAGDQP